MEDNVIKVSVRPNKQNSVKVSSNVVSTPITANSDTSQLWSQVSKNWAVSENIVDNTDYSSKYYANKAKESASNAQGYESAIRDVYNGFLGETTEAIENVQGARDEAIANIETSRVEAVDSINSTKTTILSDIEFVADGEKKEINELADVIKDNADTIINRVGISMFDTILKDHVLTYEESKGLALQGTYVYKTAVAGERYGYSDFYAKCLEEYNQAATTETVNGVTVKVHSNGHKFYDIANKTGIDDFFNTMGTAWFYGIDTANKRIFLPRNNYFEQATSDTSKVGNSVEAGLPNITGSGIWAKASETPPVGAIYKAGGNSYSNTSSGGTANYHAFDASLSNPIYGNSDTVQPNAVKKLLYICVGNTVADTSWVDVVTQVEGGVKDIEEAKDEAIDELKNITGGTVPLGFIGFSALGIDENLGLQRYLNGQIIIQDQFEGFTNYLKRRVELHPSIACLEDEWQAIVANSDFSQCGKFVIDDNAGTIRLPKVVNIQGLTDLSKLAEIVEAGLPNITASASFGDGLELKTINGAFYNAGSGSNATGAGNGTPSNLGFDASRSNSIYGNSTTVQQEQIQYPYFIQVATGAETEDNIINEIELNNPFSLLDYKYLEYELNNISWLRSNGQYNSKAIYPAVYDLLLKEYNNPDRFATFNKDAFTVIGTPTITEDGVASGFSTTSYIEIPNANLQNADTWEIEGVVQIYSDSVKNDKVWLSVSSGDGIMLPVALQDGSSQVQFQLYLSSNSTSWDIATNDDIRFESGSRVKCNLKFTGTQYIYTCTNLDTNEVKKVEINSSLKIYQSPTQLGLKRTAIALQAGDTIDLKQFSITVDGNKVFSGANSKVKLSTETFTDYDFVLNTAEETFRLPILSGSESIADYTTKINQTALPIQSNKFTAPTNGIYIASFSGEQNTTTLYINGVASSYMIGSAEVSRDQSTVSVPLSKGDVIYWDRSASIFKSSAFYSFKGNGSLYFYVGETVQNANLINAGRIEETLVKKLDRSVVKAYITQTYVNGTSWYRIWSDGWCEQGGVVGANTTTVSLLKTMSNANYPVLFSYKKSTSTADVTVKFIATNTQSTTSFTVTSSTIERNWEAKGYIA